MTMRHFLLIVFFLSFISSTSIFCENNRQGVVNSDCEYYLNHSRRPSGKLLRGQVIQSLEGFYSIENKDGSFSIYVEVETLDGAVNGYVGESFITYHSNTDLHNLWCKNILLTRHYYYTGTIEDIYKNDYAPLLEEGVGKCDSIRMMRHFFSEERVLITGNYLVLGNTELHEAYKVVSVKKENNNYLMQLLDCNKNNFEITLFDTGDAVVITRFASKNEIHVQWLIEDVLNIKYVRHEIEKSRVLKENIVVWTQKNGQRRSD